MVKKRARTVKRERAHVRTRPAWWEPSKAPATIAREGYSFCDTCGLEIRLRADGTMQAHRVGGRGVTGYPCPGAEPRVGYKANGARVRDETLTAPDGTPVTVIRDWAAEQGYQVTTSGRDIPKWVLRAWEEAVQES